MEQELLRQWLEIEPLFAVEPVSMIKGIMTLASVLAALFSGRGKDDQKGTGQLPPELMEQLLASLGIDSRQSLRNTFMVDPQFSRSISAIDLQKMGITNEQRAQLLEGAVPLRKAVNNAAFGLLPRFARSENPQEALLASSQRNRVLRGGNVGRFDNLLTGFGGGSFPTPPTPPPDKKKVPPIQGKNTKAQNCINLGGTPVYKNGVYVDCIDLPSTPGS